MAQPTCFLRPLGAYAEVPKPLCLQMEAPSMRLSSMLSLSAAEKAAGMRTFLLGHTSMFSTWRNTRSPKTPTHGTVSTLPSNTNLNSKASILNRFNRRPISTSRRRAGRYNTQKKSGRAWPLRIGVSRGFRVYGLWSTYVYICCTYSLGWRRMTCQAWRHARGGNDSRTYSHSGLVYVTI